MKWWEEGGGGGEEEEGEGVALETTRPALPQTQFLLWGESVYGGEGEVRLTLF